VPPAFPDDFGIERALRALAPSGHRRVSLPSVELRKPAPLEGIAATELWAVYSEFVLALQRRQ
jgi:hypothetical protein